MQVDELFKFLDLRLLTVLIISVLTKPLYVDRR